MDPVLSQAFEENVASIEYNLLQFNTSSFRDDILRVSIKPTVHQSHGDFPGTQQGVTGRG